MRIWTAPYGSPRDISKADLHDLWSCDFSWVWSWFGVVCSKCSREIERSLSNPWKMFYSSDFSSTTSECECEISVVNESVEFEPCSNNMKTLSTGEETSRTSSRGNERVRERELWRGIRALFVLNRSKLMDGMVIDYIKWNLHLNFSIFRMTCCTKLKGCSRGTFVEMVSQNALLSIRTLGPFQTSCYCRAELNWWN